MKKKTADDDDNASDEALKRHGGDQVSIGLLLVQCWLLVATLVLSHRNFTLHPTQRQVFWSS